jgi:hypothetical protein
LLAFNDYQATIGGLLFRRAPSAVGLFIITISINAVERFADWPFAHIGEECIEALAPTVADGDATSAIDVVVCRHWIGAATEH